MTLLGQAVDKEFVKLLALHSQRLAVIVGLLVFRFRQPEHVTVWAPFSTAATHLFHAVLRNGSSGNGMGK
jgi:hypothetical protein